MLTATLPKAKLKYINYSYELPTFLSGMASALDLGATLRPRYYEHMPSVYADLSALTSDWYVVGEDLREAIANFQASLVKNAT